MSLKREPRVTREGDTRGNADSKDGIKGDPGAPTGFRDIPLYSMDTGEATVHLMKLAHHNRIDPNLSLIHI